MTSNPQRVVGLKAENFKRLKSVEIVPDGNVVKLSGKNAQGKTSVLDAIWWALGGGAAGKRITNPIRNGEVKAEVEVTLDDFIVTRSASVDKKTQTLTVTSRDGNKLSSPQKVLDAMIGKLTFDPLEFSRLNAKEQREYLLNAVDLSIDLDQHEADRAEVFTERTYVNRQVKDLEAQVKGIEIPEDAGELVDVETLLKERDEAQAAQHAVDKHTTAISGWEGRIQQLKNELAEAEKSLADAKADYLQASDHLNGLRDTEVIQADISRAAEVNAATGKIQQKKDLEAQLAAKTKEAEKLTEQLTKFDRAKAVALASAQMPIEGLSIDGEQVTYQGQPLSQASGAELTKVSLAIAVSLNPTLRIAYIRDGSLLDSESMEIVQQIADQCEFMVFVELVDESGQVGIVIEDGNVAESIW